MGICGSKNDVHPKYSKENLDKYTKPEPQELKSMKEEINKLIQAFSLKQAIDLARKRIQGLYEHHVEFAIIASAHNDLSSLLFDNCQFQESKEETEQGLKFSKGIEGSLAFTLHQFLAKSLQEEGKYSQAIKKYTTCLNILQNDEKRIFIEANVEECNGNIIVDKLLQVVPRRQQRVL